MESESVVSHELNTEFDLLSGEFNKDVKWMIFKIKQKAETNYFKKMTRDRSPLGHPARNLSVEADVFEYGYNWPYDYFSLVELVKIDAGVSFIQRGDVMSAEQASDVASSLGSFIPGSNSSEDGSNDAGESDADRIAEMAALFRGDDD